MEWDSCRGFCAFRTEIVSPVSLYLSRGAVVGACQEPDRAAGKPRTAGRTLGAALRGKDCVIYWKGVAKVQKNRMCRIGKVWNRVNGSEWATSAETVETLRISETAL